MSSQVSSYIKELSERHDEKMLKVAERQHELELKVKEMSADVIKTAADVTMSKCM